MEEKLEPFRKHGKPGKLIDVVADEVLDAIAKDRGIYIEYAIINGNLDIKKIANQLELDERGKSIIKEGITIRDSKIHGNTYFPSAIFNYVCFASVTFNGDADFSSTIFSGGTDFSFATFKEPVDFKFATFCENTSFSSAVFNEYADLKSSTFNVYADFSSAIFNRYADFRDFTFNRYSDFKSATFNGCADFRKAIFNEDSNFSSATFNGEANFGYTIFNGDISFLSVTFIEDADFRSAAFNGKADFGYAEFTVRAHFVRTTMEHPGGFQRVSFRENTTHAGLWNYILHPLFWPIVWLLTIGKVKLPKWPVTDFSEFNTNIIMDGLSNPYLKRYIDDEQWITSWRKTAWWREVLFRIWELTSHCGRSIGLWAFWSIVIAVAFAFIYQGFGCDSIAFNVDKLNGVQPGFWGYLYYSVVTFTTLGFGDIVPLTNPARLAVGAEVVLGYIMLGGLISIFANKFARRS